MPVSEKINIPLNKEYFTEQEPSQGDSLRDALLSAPEQKGSYVTIPRGTVMIEANSETVEPELFDDLFPGVAAEVRQEHMPAFPSSVHEQGYGKTSMGTFMSSIDRNVQADIGKDELSSNITLLYDGNYKDVEGETQSPSAVLVHEELTSDQIAAFRKKLPENVPMIDAKTNRLLDKEGAAEREEGRRNIRIRREMGAVTLREAERSHHSAAGEAFIKAYANVQPTSVQNADEYASTYVPQQEDATSHESDEYEFNEYGYEYEEPKEKIPESDEVRTHRESKEADAKAEEQLREYAENTAAALREREQQASDARAIVEEAAQEKYGRPIDELSDQERKSLRRDAAKKYHPDYASQKDTVNRDTYEAFEQILK